LEGKLIGPNQKNNLKENSWFGEFEKKKLITTKLLCPHKMI
jgi:hypothetical protein